MALTTTQQIAAQRSAATTAAATQQSSGTYDSGATYTANDYAGKVTPATPATPVNPDVVNNPRTPTAGIPATYTQAGEQTAEASQVAARRSQAQSYIDTINQNFANQVDTEEALGKDRTAAQNALLASSGLAGGSTAESSVAGTKEKTAANVRNIQTNQASQIADIFQKIDTQAQADAMTIYKGEVADKQANQATAQTNLTDLAKTSTVTWKDFAAQQPDYAQKLLEQTGYDEATAAFKFNASKQAAQQIQWQAPQKTDTGYMFYGVNPMTGKVETQEVTVPTTGDWSVSPANLYQDTLMVNKKTGEIKTLAQYNNAVPGNIEALAPTGSQGGECGVFVHTIVDNVPQMGDTLASKTAICDVKAADWKPKIGDVVIQDVGTEAGHASVVNKVNSDGTVQLTESNYSAPNTVSNDRTISSTDKTVVGAYTKGQIKGSIAEGTKSQRGMMADLAYQQKLASLKRTETLTEGSDAMIASRRNTAVKTVITNLYGSAAKNPAAIYNNSAQVINRVDPSLARALDPNNTAKNVADLDLIDAYVQIARGGQAITEAQVDTLLSGLGLSAKFDVASQKITGSATLDDASRKELANLSHKIYDEQGKSAQTAVKQVNDQLKKQGIPDKFLLNKPEDLTVSANVPSLTPEQITQFTGQLQQGEVLAQDSSGNVVAATQADIDSGEYAPLSE